MRNLFSVLFFGFIGLLSACGGGGGGDPSRDNFVPALSPFHSGMPEVNIEQTSMTVTLGFADQRVLGFLPLEKAIQFTDISLVCVNSTDHVWAGGSSHCAFPDSKGIAKVTDTAADDCFQIYLKFKNGSESWSNLDDLVMTGRQATKVSLANGTQCLRYGVTPVPVPVPLPPLTPEPPTSVPVPVPPPAPTLHVGMSEVNVDQNSMAIMLGFDGQSIRGFFSNGKQIRLTDVAKVCVDSNNLGWGDVSNNCGVPDTIGIAAVSRTLTNDCFNIHLKLQDGSIIWGDLNSLVMTGRPVTKITNGDSQCMQYGTASVPVPTPTPTPVPTPIPAPTLHVGMSEVNVDQNSMTVMLGFDGQSVLGFFSNGKEVRLADVAKVCVDSNNLGWGDVSNHCGVSNAIGIATVPDTLVNDCFNIHLKLQDGSIAWGDLNSLVTTGRPATKITNGDSQCMQY